MEHHGEGCELIPPVVIHLDTEGKHLIEYGFFGNFFHLFFQMTLLLFAYKIQVIYDSYLKITVFFFRFNVGNHIYFPGGGYRDGDLTNLFQFFRTSASINR